MSLEKILDRQEVLNSELQELIHENIRIVTHMIGTSSNETNCNIAAGDSKAPNGIIEEISLAQYKLEYLIEMLKSNNNKLNGAVYCHEQVKCVQN